MDLRKKKRVRLDLPVKVKVLGDGSFMPEAREGQLHDLSTGGCSFRFDHEIPIGTRVEVHVALNELLSRKFNKPELIALGAICRIERHEFGFLLSVRFFH